MIRIRRALISVSDKNGLIPFAKELRKKKIEIISTGGTLRALKEAGIDAIPVDKVTNFPEMMEGRVKTLHPMVHGGLLYRRDKAEHRKQAKKHGIQAIDLVVVNLYPFEQVTSRKGVALETAIENIDIGGPSMLRSAAKNHDAVAVVCDPGDYDLVLQDLAKNKGAVSTALKRRLALKVFQRTADYDCAIAEFLGGRKEMEEKIAAKGLPESVAVGFKKKADLRYGENPHQKAALYESISGKSGGEIEQYHGKELSFNNLMDIEGAVEIISEFKEPAVCVVKHTNPCGVAQDKKLVDAAVRAIECDPLSAFGGIVGMNRKCDLATAKKIFEMLYFFEVVVAPGYSKDALKILKTRKNMRVIRVKNVKPRNPYDVRFLRNGDVLVQDRDKPILAGEAKLKKSLRCVTRTKVTKKDIDDLLFAWKCVKVVKSNAIVLTQGMQTVGIGAGQMSRVDSVKIACDKAGARTEGGLLASDAFFPMPDSIEVAHKHGIRAIIQPGGSIRDNDVIEACDRLGVAMVLTGERHFKH